METQKFSKLMMGLVASLAIASLVSCNKSDGGGGGNTAPAGLAVAGDGRSANLAGDPDFPANIAITNIQPATGGGYGYSPGYGYSGGGYSPSYLGGGGNYGLFGSGPSNGGFGSGQGFGALPTAMSFVLQETPLSNAGTVTTQQYAGYNGSRPVTVQVGQELDYYSSMGIANACMVGVKDNTTYYINCVANSAKLIGRNAFKQRIIRVLYSIRTNSIIATQFTDSVNGETDGLLNQPI